MGGEGGTVLARKWKGHLIACIVHLAAMRQSPSGDSAAPSRHKPDFYLLGSNIRSGLLPLPLARSIPKTRKGHLGSMRQRNDHSVSASHQPSNTPCNSGNQKGPVELVHGISESRDECRIQLRGRKIAQIITRAISVHHPSSGTVWWFPWQKLALEPDLEWSFAQTLAHRSPNKFSQISYW